MSMGTHELLRQLDDVFNLCEKRTQDLELAAKIGQTLLQSNAKLEAELDQLKQRQAFEAEERQGEKHCGEEMEALEEKLKEAEKKLAEVVRIMNYLTVIVKSLPMYSQLV